MVATAPSSPVSPAGNAPTQSFSAMLEQAQPSPSASVGTLAGISDGLARGDSSLMSSPSKREAKTSDPKSSDVKTPDSKTNDSQGHGHAETQIPSPGTDLQDKAVPLVVVQPPPAPALPWTAEIKDFTPDAPGKGTALNDKTLNDGVLNSTALNNTALNNTAPNNTLLNTKVTTSSTSGFDSTAKPDTTGGSTLLSAPSKDVVLERPQADANGQDSASPTSVNTGDAGAVASLIAHLPGTATSDAKAQPGNAPTTSEGRNISRGSAESTDGVNKRQAGVKSETEQVVVPLSVVPPAPVSPALVPEKVELGGTRGTQVKAASDKSRVGLTQESSGTTQKNSEVAEGAKAQPRKDDSPSSSSSQAADQGTGGVPAKASDASPSFSVAGIQSALTTGDGKSASASTSAPHEAGAPPEGQLEQKSTGVVQSQAQGEAAAAYPTSLVHSAKLVERIGEAELRLGIRAGEFGSVDIRTSMVRNQFTAEISVERGELGRVMAAELPSLQNRLTEQRVPVANITLQNHTGSQSTTSEQQKPRDGQQQYAVSPVSAREEGPMPALVALEGTAPASRLDIHM